VSIHRATCLKLDEHGTWTCSVSLDECRRRGYTDCAVASVKKSKRRSPMNTHARHVALRLAAVAIAFAALLVTAHLSRGDELPTPPICFEL
jgi:hypothetical protein